MIRNSLRDAVTTERRRLVLTAVIVLAVTAAVATASTVWATDGVAGRDDRPETATYAVVVDGVDGGVGAYNLTVSVQGSASARITRYDPHDSARLTNTSISADGTSVVAMVALMDTANSGRVTVGTVTVRGTGIEAADVGVAVAALGDETGHSYETKTGTDWSVRVVPTADRSSSNGASGGDSGGSSGGGASTDARSPDGGSSGSVETAAPTVGGPGTDGPATDRGTGTRASGGDRTDGAGPDAPDRGGVTTDAGTGTVAAPPDDRADAAGPPDTVGDGATAEYDLVSLTLAGVSVLAALLLALALVALRRQWD